MALFGCGMDEPVQKRILIIEDDAESAGLLEEDLVERGFAVSLSHSGQEGLAAVIRDRPDLILCDITLPSMSGLELLSRMVELVPLYGTVPFVFITALASRDDELYARRLGADDYVVKPIDFDVLAAIIESRLARVARDTAAANNIQLSARETEMLAWSARGKTSSEIAEIVRLTKRTVDFHIDNARRKLQVETRVEAAVKAVVAGLIKL
jgi:DNA-binding response OmpR family regulator